MTNSGFSASTQAKQPAAVHALANLRAASNMVQFWIKFPTVRSYNDMSPCTGPAAKNTCARPATAGLAIATALGCTPPPARSSLQIMLAQYAAASPATVLLQTALPDPQGCFVLFSVYYHFLRSAAFPGAPCGSVLTARPSHFFAIIRGACSHAFCFFCDLDGLFSTNLYRPFFPAADYEKFINNFRLLKFTLFFALDYLILQICID